MTRCIVFPDSLHITAWITTMSRLTRSVFLQATLIENSTLLFIHYKKHEASDEGTAEPCHEEDLEDEIATSVYNHARHHGDDSKAQVLHRLHYAIGGAQLV